jgi:hypothetical protein
MNAVIKAKARNTMAAYKASLTGGRLIWKKINKGPENGIVHAKAQRQRQDQKQNEFEIHQVPIILQR